MNEFIRIKLNGYKGIQLNRHRNIELNGFKKIDYINININFKLKKYKKNYININTELNIYQIIEYCYNRLAIFRSCSLKDRVF